MFRSRKFYLSLLGAVAWSTTATDTILDIINAASLPTSLRSSVGLAAVASALDVLALGSVTLYSSQYVWTRDGLIKHSRKGQRILAACCIVTSFGALIVSLASIVNSRAKLKTHSPNPDSHWDSRLSGQIVIWILACLSQLTLFTSPFWIKPTPKAQSVTISGPRDSVMSELHRHSDTTQSIYMLEPTYPSSPLAALPSPTFSTRSSQSLKSWRDSLHYAVRPHSSRSKLVKATSTRSIYSDSHHSVDNISQSDLFETWEAEPQNKELAMQLAAVSQIPFAPTKGTVLEAIPQSRPQSPARALDGPFPVTDDIQELPPPPKMMLDTSRPPSPNVSESHIHPLFRTESPTPPPAATPGTSIIASPLSDQMIACPSRPYSRMRSNSSRSIAASPSPLVHARSFTREHTLSAPSNRSRSQSPVSREMTPPIPDFVLNSSPRSSLSQSVRKVNLHSDTNRSVSG